MVMARRIRIQYPGAVYHVMARDNDGWAVVGDDMDRKRFLAVLGERAVGDGALHASEAGHWAGQTVARAKAGAAQAPAYGVPGNWTMNNPKREDYRTDALTLSLSSKRLVHEYN
jgi:hypothetical protein